VGGTLTALQRVEVVRRADARGALELLVGAPAPRRWPARLCEGFEVALLVGPPHISVVAGRRLDVPSGVPFVKLPGTVWSAPRSTAGFLSLELSPTLFARLASEWPQRLQLRAFVGAPGALDEFWAAHRVLRTDDDAAARSHALTRLLRSLFEELGGRMRVPEVATSRGLERARELMHDDPARVMTAEALAEVVGVSMFVVERVFKRRFGVSPLRYRDAIRVARARRLLAQGESIAEVTTRLGFASVESLRALFSGAVGVTPERYVERPCFVR
jgi:AraC-like DNA-binding protein